MASINKEQIKDFVTKNGYGSFMVDDFMNVKSKKDIKAFEEKWKRSIEAIKQEMMAQKLDQLYNEIMESNGQVFEGMTRADIFGLPDFREKVGDIYGEKYDVIYGIPDNLFVKDQRLDPKDRLAATKARFAAAGLDFDNKEDRLAAARKQALTETKEAGRDAKDEPKTALGKAAGAFEKYIGTQTPRADAKVEAGEEVTAGDAVADILRIGEAGTPIIAVPSIIARNVLEGVMDEKGVVEGLKDTGKDLAVYLGSAGLSKYLPGRTSSKLTAENLTSKTGSGKQLERATQYALGEGKKPSIFNPYVNSAMEAVEKAGLDKNQKKKFSGLLSKYTKDYDKEKLVKAAEGSSSNKFQMGAGAFNEQIGKEAEKIGEAALKNTKETKLNFETVARNLTAEQAEELNKLLASRGLRDAAGNVSYSAVGDFGRNAKAARDIAESKVVMEYLKKNKSAMRNAFWEEATDAVKKNYGTSRDVEFLPLAQFIAATPTAYEKVVSKKGAKTAAKAATANFLRKYLTDAFANYNFKEDE